MSTQFAPASAAIEAAALRSDRFRFEREADWKRLEEIVTRMEKGQLRRLSDEDVQALPVLYRTVASSLSVAREISLDAATLDRFATLEMRYDAPLERAIASQAAEGAPALAEAWLELVQKTRALCLEHDFRHIVSPRATQQGLNLLTGGITAEGATIMVLRRGLDETSWGRIRPRIHAAIEHVEATRLAALADKQPR